MDPEGGAWTHPAVRSTVDSGRSVSQKSEFLISIFCQCLHASCMFSNTRFVWVEINNTKPRNYGRVTASPKWHLVFSKQVVFFPRESRYRYQVQCKSHCAADDGTATWHLYLVFPSVMEYRLLTVSMRRQVIAPRTQSGLRRSRGRRRGAAPPCGGGAS